MTHITTKTFLATAAFALAGAAFAQGTPPNPNVPNPAMGAGQQTQQGTPMGTTGTPTATPGGAMSNTTPAAGAGMSNNSGSTGAMSSGSATRPMRPARADRN